MKKPLLIAGVVSTIGLAGLGAGVAHAATSTDSSDNPMSSLVDKIATKFNLNKDEVQALFDENRTEMEAKREEQVKSDLADLVKAGTITQTQADAITAKRAELQTQRESNKDSFKDLTADERKAKMEEERTALEAWAKEQGLDTKYLRYVMGHGPGGPGGPGMRGERPDDSRDSATSTN